MYSYKNKNGFTLPEVLIAIVVLMVGLLGVAGLTIIVIRGNVFSKQITTAVTIASDQMERMKALGFAGTASTDTTTTEAYGTLPDFPLYKRTTSIDVDSPATRMKIVTVKVFWDADKHKVELRTILAE